MQAAVGVEGVEVGDITYARRGHELVVLLELLFRNRVVRARCTVEEPLYRSVQTFQRPAFRQAFLCHEDLLDGFGAEHLVRDDRERSGAFVERKVAGRFHRHDILLVRFAGRGRDLDPCVLGNRNRPVPVGFHLEGECIGLVGRKRGQCKVVADVLARNLDLRRDVLQDVQVGSDVLVLAAALEGDAEITAQGCRLLGILLDVERESPVARLGEGCPFGFFGFVERRHVRRDLDVVMGGIASRYDLVRLDVVDDEPDVRFVGALVDDEGRFGLPAVRIAEYDRRRTRGVGIVVLQAEAYLAVALACLGVEFDPVSVRGVAFDTPVAVRTDVVTDQFERGVADDGLGVETQVGGGGHQLARYDGILQPEVGAAALRVVVAARDEGRRDQEQRRHGQAPHVADYVFRVHSAFVFRL